MSNLSFEIKTTEDFFKMLIEDYKEFCVNRTSSRHALHCAIVAWHLTDWAYKEFIKPTTQFKGKQDKKNHWKYFLKEIKDSCPELQIMNDITDGTKHFSLDRPSKIKETNLHNGAFDQSFEHSF